MRLIFCRKRYEPKWKKERYVGTGEIYEFVQGIVYNLLLSGKAQHVIETETEKVKRIEFMRKETPKVKVKKR